MKNATMKQRIEQAHKPIIETLINTTALALTTTGVLFMTREAAGWEHFIKGGIIIVLGASLEFFKYMGRQRRLW